MKKNKRSLIIAGFFAFATLFLAGCKNDDPSVLKIFVRSNSNELLNAARVVIIGDLQSNPPSKAFVDTVYTNSSGFAEFDMDSYFDSSGDETGYFDVLVEKDTLSGTGYVRCRQHITTVETVYLN